MSWLEGGILELERKIYLVDSQHEKRTRSIFTEYLVALGNSRDNDCKYATKKLDGRPEHLFCG